MELPQPGCIAHIGFTPWHVLGVTGVDQNDLKPMLLQNLVSRYPVNTGGFHRNAGDTARGKPSCKIMQVVSKGSKRPYRDIRMIRIDSRHVHPRSDINGGGARLDRR
jgi:hypothetical protein